VSPAARSPHRLIHASAGTGKTWQLSGRFLALLAGGVEPRRILATTFTRKAAGEIQDRVLERLARACLEEPARRELEGELARPFPAAEARALLARLTRRLGELRVLTLDAFFVHLAKLFALELGLPPDWSIVEEAEDQALQREAVARTLARSERLELLGLLRGLQQADASRSVEHVLLAEVRRARNAFLDSRPEAWGRVRAPEGAAPAETAAALARLARVPLPRTAKGEPYKAWTRELAGLAARVEAEDWREFAAKGLGAKVLAGEAEYQGQEIPEAMRPELELLARQARHALVDEVARFNAAALGWLARFEASYEELKAEERAYRFEDLPKALHPRDESRLAEREQIWFRLDGQLDHLLLDEFQDTSPVQWRILAPLAEEILADGTGTRSFFCVGDLKQSIYGWREAEPRLLASMAQRYPVLAPVKLTRSYRSAHVVLDTVRRTFETIGLNPAFDRAERVRAAGSFREDFDAHEPVYDLPGAAWLVEAPRADGEDEAEAAVLALAARRARAIADEAPHATIGILLRRNELIARLIFLLRDQGLRASGEGGNPLTDSMAVLHLLSLLHLSDHPGDSAAAFHVATSPLGALAGLVPASFREQQAEVARVTRRRLALEGTGAFTASFLAAVDAGYGAWDRRRFRQLVDLALAHDERADLRADRFVDHVRVTRVEDPAAAQVQVMTVHSAKGLEFDAVILPELDVHFSLRESELLCARPDPAGLLTTVSHARSREVCRLSPLLAELWSERAERETREALCLLYVAMTRARHRLDLLVQHKKDPARTSHDFAGILRAALGRGPADAEGVLWRHPQNRVPWIEPPPARPKSAAPAVAAARPFRAGAEPRALPHRAPSAAEGGGELAAAELLAAPRSDARVAGAWIHRWLAAVEWLEDFRASDAELFALARPLGAEGKLARAALGELRAFLAQPATRAELALGGAPRAERTVWRERPFSLVLDEPDGTRALWSGAFDRVVLQGRAGAWTSAVVTDFKTDRVAPGEVEARVAFYRPQLEGYRRVLARMLALPEAAVTARLLFLRADAVRDL
jgi:ATP-dependent exoDNAse (exonuclease V) beta subunit